MPLSVQLNLDKNEHDVKIIFLIKQVPAIIRVTRFLLVETKGNKTYYVQLVIWLVPGNVMHDSGFQITILTKLDFLIQSTIHPFNTLRKHAYSNI